jgi:hypothetical protein
MRKLRAVFFVGLGHVSSKRQWLRNHSRAAQAAGLNCGKRCKVQLASTRMVFVSMGLVPIGRYWQGSTRPHRGPHHDVGLSPSDADQMVAHLIAAHARRKASGRATQDI